MNITETSTDGLKREFQVVISAKDIEEKVNGKLVNVVFDTVKDVKDPTHK